MKTMNYLGGILFCILYITGNAQPIPPVQQAPPVKPSLFNRLPEHFPISTSAIKKIFSGSATGYIKISAGDYGYLEGYVFQKVKKSDNVLTINIRLTNYDEALFSISRTTTNGHEHYAGRVIHRNYRDVLLLSEEDGGELFLNKENQSLFLVE